MNNKSFGNRNTRLFIMVIVVVLFVGGFVKSMMNVQTKQTVETNHLLVELNNDWTLVSEDDNSDTIILKDSSGKAEITYGIASNTEEPLQTINNYSVYSSTNQTSDGYNIHVSLVNDKGEVAEVSYDTKLNITYKNTKIQKLLKNIIIK